LRVVLGEALREPSRDLILLGSTGSIGRQTLDVVRRYRHRLRVVGIASYGHDINQLRYQITNFKPKYVALVDTEVAKTLASEFPEVKVLYGPDALSELVEVEGDTVVSAVVGFAGLEPTLKAVKMGKKVALANKESMVVAGHLFQPYLSRIVPIDSEHSAIFQALEGNRDYLDPEIQTPFFQRKSTSFTPPLCCDLHYII